MNKYAGTLFTRTVLNPTGSDFFDIILNKYISKTFNFFQNSGAGQLLAADKTIYTANYIYL